MNLGRLCDATQYRLDRLHKLYDNIGTLTRPEQGLQLAYISIELDNLNICALREFTISTVRGARTTTGKKISVNNVLETEEEIGAYILSIVNSVRYSKLKSPSRIKRTDEPTMRDPKEIEKILTAIGASNLGSLQNALALNSNIFRDLKFIRHFYAHRCKDTFLKVTKNAIAMGVQNSNHPDDILRHVVAGRGHTVIEQWLMEAKLFYQLLME